MQIEKDAHPAVLTPRKGMQIKVYPDTVLPAPLDAVTTLVRCGFHEVLYRFTLSRSMSRMFRPRKAHLRWPLSPEERDKDTRLSLELNLTYPEPDWNPDPVETGPLKRM